MLMVSGVGPAATLQKLNIPVISDLPGVGQNMWVSGHTAIQCQSMPKKVDVRSRTNRILGQRTVSM